jgi:hypothetical protein
MPSIDDFLQAAWKVHQAGEPGRARKLYQQAIDQQPDHPNAWCYLGIALHDLKHYPQAIAAYERAIALHPHFPIAYNNLGNSLRYDFRPVEAEQAFQKAISLDPNYLSAHKNLGTLHAWQGDSDRAVQAYRRVAELAPEDAENHRNLGVLYLLRGDFSRGWPEYRWRWRCREALQHRYPVPRWQGESLQGKTILLYAEQGLGDTLNFVRFAQTLKDRGANTIVHAQGNLAGLLRDLPGIDHYLPSNVRVEQPFDYHCSLLDVADILEIDSAHIPLSAGYLRPPAYLVPYWQRWFAELPSASLRIGLVWQGNRDHQADTFRSFPLATFQSLAELRDVQFISLQQGFGAEQLGDWPGPRPLLALPDGTDQTSGTFMDTAAILFQLDLVITSDTSIAHLAGALGRPAWVLLNKMPDWRWMLERDDSPWYDSLRLFRQATQGDWPGVVAQVKQALMARDF